MKPNSTQDYTTIRDSLVSAGLWDAGDERNPADDLAAAWLVVEKMREMVDECAIFSFSIDYSGGGKRWESEVVTYDDRGILIFEEDTAPLAICRAALAALEAG